MNKAEYDDYLKSDRWKYLTQAIRRAVKACEMCSFPYELNVHHKTYKRVGNERREDLIVLCRSCHSRHHFVETADSIPDYLFNGGRELSLSRLETQLAESKKKNVERADEVRQNLRRFRDSE